MKAKLFFIQLVAIIAVLTVISCKRDRNDLRVSLDDSLQLAIRTYVQENNIDVNSSVITTDWVVNPYRTDVYISATSKGIDNSIHNVPTYYSVASDSIIVLIYSGVERGVIRNTEKVSEEIKDLLAKKDVKLMADSVSVSRQLTWLYSSCGEKRELITEPSISDLLYVPCRDFVSQNILKGSSQAEIEEDQ